MSKAGAADPAAPGALRDALGLDTAATAATGADGPEQTDAALEPEADPTLVYWLRAVTADLDLDAAAFAAANGLHLTDLRALIALLDAQRLGESATPGLPGPPARAELARHHRAARPVDGLGFTARERDPDDRRRVLVRVTDDARTTGGAFFGPLLSRLLTALDEQPQADRHCNRPGAGALHAAPPQGLTVPAAGSAAPDSSPRGPPGWRFRRFAASTYQRLLVDRSTASPAIPT